MIFWRKYFALNRYYPFLYFQSNFLISILPSGCNFNIKINSNFTGKRVNSCQTYEFGKKDKTVFPACGSAGLVECSQRLSSPFSSKTLPFTVDYQDQALTWKGRFLEISHAKQHKKSSWRTNSFCFTLPSVLKVSVPWMTVVDLLVK